MSEIVIQVENLSKKYRLGSIGAGTLSRDLNQWWARIRGKEDPYAVIDPSGNTSCDKDDFWALQNISFKVSAGEALGIIGKNGAGKSTLLKILSRITTPTTGEARIDGRVASLLEVGTGFHHELTGRENIFLNGAILGMTKNEIRSKLDEIIDFSGVEKHIDTPIKRYSSGMFVRLAFAVAAHLDPEILIVDEVLAVGDAEFQRKCLGKMNQVTGEGRTVLFVSHNMAAVKNLCSRGILLHNGKITFNGTANQAINSYLDLTAEHIKPMIEWNNVKEAPGNDEVKIMAVRVLNCGNQISSSIPIHEDFYIEIDFVNLKDGLFLTSHIQLYNGGGSGVLSSGNWPSTITNHDPFAGKSYRKGFYRSRVKIQGFFLNAGLFYINAMMLKDVLLEVAVANEAVYFEILDTGETCKEHSDEWLGVVRPKLEWETEPVQQ
jgi:lipopolysaccharide transport system ATP-binding protein